MATEQRHRLKAQISEQALLALHDAPDDFGGKLLIRSDAEALLHAGSEEAPLQTRNRHHAAMSAWANKCKRADESLRITAQAGANFLCSK